MITLKHYIHRAFLDKIGLGIYVLVPVALIVVIHLINQALIEGTYHHIDGYDFIASEVVLFQMLLFQFLGGMFIIDYIFIDLKSARRWRLLAAPVSFNRFIFSALAASMLFMLISGLAILAFGFFFMNIYLGNLPIIIGLMLLVGLMSQFISIIASLLIKSKGAAEGTGMAVYWVFIIASGNFMGISLGIPDFINENINPFNLTLSAVRYTWPAFDVPRGGDLSNFVNVHDLTAAFANMGILAAWVVVLGIAIIIIGRRRPI